MQRPTVDEADAAVEHCRNLVRHASGQGFESTLAAAMLERAVVRVSAEFAAVKDALEKPKHGSQVFVLWALARQDPKLAEQVRRELQEPAALLRGWKSQAFLSQWVIADLANDTEARAAVTAHLDPVRVGVRIMVDELSDRTDDDIALARSIVQSVWKQPPLEVTAEWRASLAQSH